MGTMIELTASDGFTFDAYHVAPAGPRKGGLVLIQEIFGLTAWIKRTADHFGALGYEVIAPSLYDRIERGFIAAEVTPETLQKGVKLATENGLKKPVIDMQACVDACLQAPPLPGSQLAANLAKRGFVDHHDHFTNSTPASEWRTCLEHAEKIGLGTRAYELVRMK